MPLTIATTLRRPLLRPILAFVAVVAGGVAGFSTLGDVGAVEALFWLVDPSSLAVHFRQHGGPATLAKGYAVFVMVSLVVTGLWIAETVLSATFGGTISRELREMQAKRTIEDLEDHVVICGYGTFGRTVADRLRSADRGVVVVEEDEAQYRAATDDDLLTVQGDARREATLSAAGIERADCVVGAIDDSNVNIQTAIATSELAPDVRIVVRVGDETYESLARHAGADEVVVPEVVSGEQVTRSL